MSNYFRHGSQKEFASASSPWLAWRRFSWSCLLAASLACLLPHTNKNAKNLQNKRRFSRPKWTEIVDHDEPSLHCTSKLNRTNHEVKLKDEMIGDFSSLRPTSTGPKFMAGKSITLLPSYLVALKVDMLAHQKANSRCQSNLQRILRSNQPCRSMDLSSQH